MIKELIVVEGKNDLARLKQIFGDIDVITTNGSEIPDETFEIIRKASSSKGVILFLDPDGPGEMIRAKIIEAVPNCKHAYIEKKLARTDKKVGVEHAKKEDIIKSLENVYSIDEKHLNITFSDMIRLQLTSNNSKKLREFVSSKLNIGNPNSKQFIKRVNMFNIKLEEVERIIGEYNE